MHFNPPPCGSELVKDSNRYKYLRDEGVPELCVVYNGKQPLYDDELDKAIDAAIEKTK